MPAIDPDGNPGYIYLQTADVIAARIRAGRYDNDDGKPPGERAAAELGVSCQTCRQAMRVLRDRGLIITRQGRGTFLAPHTARTTTAGQAVSPLPSGQVTRPAGTATQHRDQAPQQDTTSAPADP